MKKIISDRRSGVTLSEKESQVVNQAIICYVGKVGNMLPVDNKAWSIIATITRKLEKRKMYHAGYEDFNLELELLSALTEGK